MNFRYLKYYLFIIPVLLLNHIESFSQDADKVYKDAVNSVGLITDMNGVGSGFFVNSNTFITNRHVSKQINKRKAIIRLKDGTTIKPLNVLFEDKNNDLAAFQTETYNYSIKLLDNSDPKIGEKVFAIGNPASTFNVYEFTITEGIINNITLEDIPSNEYPISAKVILHSASLNKGNSGGPLLNTNGEVLGINSYFYVQGNNQFIAIHVEELIKLLKKYNISYNGNIASDKSGNNTAKNDSTALHSKNLIPKLTDSSGTVRLSNGKNSGSPLPFILILIIGTFFIFLLIVTSRGNRQNLQQEYLSFNAGTLTETHAENSTAEYTDRQKSERKNLNAYIKYNNSYYYLKQDTFTIGRELDCDLILLDDIFVSKRHCRIFNKNGIYILRDLNSKNGTLLNNKPAYSEILNDRDVITIGKLNLFFYIANFNNKYL